MAGNRIGIEAVYNSVLPSPISGQAVPVQADAFGSLRTILMGTGGDPAARIQIISDNSSSGIGGLIVNALGLGFNGSGWDRLRVAAIVKNIAAVAVTAGTGVTIWTPSAGKKFRLLGFVLAASVSTPIILKDGSTEFLRVPAVALAGVPSPQMGNGYLSTAANNVLAVDVGNSGNVHGFVIGVEE